LENKNSFRVDKNEGKGAGGRKEKLKERLVVKHNYIFLI